MILHRPDTFREGDLLYGLVIGKFIGPQYLQDTPAQYPIKAYRFADLAIGYKTPRLLLGSGVVRPASGNGAGRLWCASKSGRR